MRAAQYGYDTAFPKIIAERIRQQRGLGEGTDKHQVKSAREFLFQVLAASITNELYIMAFLFTPGGDHLRHDAGQICVHDLAPERVGRPLTNEVDHADL